jgi:hypothetical protein
MKREEAIRIYENRFGKVDESKGFNLTTTKWKRGIIVKKFYSRNDFHCELEDEVWVHDDGKIFKNGKEITPVN